MPLLLGADALAQIFIVHFTTHICVIHKFDLLCKLAVRAAYVGDQTAKLGQGREDINNDFFRVDW